MYCIYNGWIPVANFIFALSLISLLISLFISIVEIWQSTRALEALLKDAEGLEDESLMQKLFGSRQDDVSRDSEGVQ
jgi:hypothetical protein